MHAFNTFYCKQTMIHNDAQAQVFSAGTSVPRQRDGQQVAFATQSANEVACVLTGCLVSLCVLGTSFAQLQLLSLTCRTTSCLLSPTRKCMRLFYLLFDLFVSPDSWQRRGVRRNTSHSTFLSLDGKVAERQGELNHSRDCSSTCRRTTSHLTSLRNVTPFDLSFRSLETDDWVAGF